MICFPAVFPESLLSCLDLDQIVCVSIEPFGPCPTLTICLPSPGELPPHRPGPALRQGLFLATASAQTNLQTDRTFCPLSDTNCTLSRQSTEFFDLPIWGWRGRLSGREPAIELSGPLENPPPLWRWPLLRTWLQRRRRAWARAMSSGRRGASLRRKAPVPRRQLHGGWSLPAPTG